MELGDKSDVRVRLAVDASQQAERLLRVDLMFTHEVRDDEGDRPALALLAEEGDGAAGRGVAVDEVEDLGERLVQLRAAHVGEPQVLELDGAAVEVVIAHEGGEDVGDLLRDAEEGADAQRAHRLEVADVAVGSEGEHVVDDGREAREDGASRPRRRQRVAAADVGLNLKAAAAEAGAGAERKAAEADAGGHRHEVGHRRRGGDAGHAAEAGRQRGSVVVVVVFDVGVEGRADGALGLAAAAERPRRRGAHLRA
mmetsp:Transcript_46403/g.143229  ORF Transcript_46403/g.143229 Transcript_46403/m.143229 type:complete len:254 (-) Transcript_46403:400-1161(-)